MKTQLLHIKEYVKKNIMDVWDVACDREMGGFVNDRDRAMNVRSYDKGAWGQGRSIYNYSYAYKMYGDSKYLEFARSGIEFVLGKMYCGNGRFNYLTDRQGNVKVGPISVFSDAFIIVGIAKYIAVSGDNGYSDVLRGLYEKFVANITDRHFKDVAPQQYDPDVCHHSLVMIGLNVAYEVEQALHCDVSYLRNYCLDAIFNILYDFETGVIFEKKHWDGSLVEQGGDFVNVGHVYECMWFVLETALAVNDDKLFKKAQDVADKMYMLTGTDDGMLFSYNARGCANSFSTWKYEIDFKQDDKVSWGYAEAMYLWFLLYAKTSDPKYLERFDRLYRFTNEHFLDNQYGDWFHALDKDNNVIQDFKGSTVKCPFHMTRAYWRIVENMENLYKKDGN